MCFTSVLLLGALLGHGGLLSGSVEALGKASYGRRHLHAKHCLEHWLKVHRDRADWEHWQCKRQGLQTSQVTSELLAAPSQAPPV